MVADWRLRDLHLEYGAQLYTRTEKWYIFGHYVLKLRNKFVGQRRQIGTANNVVPNIKLQIIGIRD